MPALSPTILSSALPPCVHSRSGWGKVLRTAPNRPRCGGPSGPPRRGPNALRFHAFELGERNDPRDKPVAFVVRWRFVGGVSRKEPRGKPVALHVEWERVIC
jgi:hypothetical protein